MTPDFSNLPEHLRQAAERFRSQMANLPVDAVISDFTSPRR